MTFNCPTGHSKKAATVMFHPFVSGTKLETKIPSLFLAVLESLEIFSRTRIHVRRCGYQFKKQTKAFGLVVVLATIRMVRYSLRDSVYSLLKPSLEFGECSLFNQDIFLFGSFISCVLFFCFWQSSSAEKVARYFMRHGSLMPGPSGFMLFF